MKNVILEATNLCKSFTNEGVENTVLDNMDVKVYEGDFTVIMGSSGSGKSTLLYSLSGMDKPTAGSVFYKGEDITNLNEKKMAHYRVKEFGFVFQQVHLVGNLTIQENILVPGYMNDDISAKEAKEKAKLLMDKMHIDNTKNRLPSQVSGGEAQRAAIARAVINNPGLLFADEPTGALNRSNTRDVLDLLTDLNKEGQSILMVTHDSKAAIRATRIIYIDDGKVCGEIELPPYTAEAKKDREAKVNEWLNSMQW